MISRRIQTSIAVILAAIWGFSVYFEHDRGALRFLDRIESTTIDIRTLARGKRVPPDLVTIVAIDDDIVKLRGVYPLSRIDLAKIVDTIARLGPKVIAIDLLLIDNGPPDADEALENRSQRVRLSLPPPRSSRKPARRFLQRMTKARSRGSQRQRNSCCL